MFIIFSFNTSIVKQILCQKVFMPFGRDRRDKMAEKMSGAYR